MAMRPMGVAEILDGSVRLAWRHARITMPAALPLAAILALAVGLLGTSSRATIGTGTSLQLTEPSVWLPSVLAGFLTTVLAGVLTPVYVGALLGRPADLRAALRGLGVRLALGLLALALVVTIGESVGLVLLLVAGIWLWGVWAVAAPALVEERLGPLASLRRSFALVRTSFWRVWGIRALSWLMRKALEITVTLPLATIAVLVSSSRFAGGVVHPVLFATIVALGRLIASTVLFPVGAATDVLLYTDLRMRREGLDLLLAAPPAAVPAHLAGPATSVPAPARAW